MLNLDLLFNNRYQKKPSLQDSITEKIKPEAMAQDDMAGDAKRASGLNLQTISPGLEADAKRAAMEPGPVHADIPLTLQTPYNADALTNEVRAKEDAGGFTLGQPPDFSPQAPAPVRLREISPSYGKYSDSVKAMPTEKEYVDSHQHTGVGGRIGSGFRTLGKVLLRSGFNPFAAAAGGVTAAINPGAEATYDYRTDVQPREYARQDRLLNQAGHEIGAWNVLEDNDRARQGLDLQREGMDITRDAHNQQRDYQNYLMQDHEHDNQMQEAQYRLNVEKFVRDTQRAEGEAKTKQEAEQYRHLHDAAQLYLNTGRPLPPEITSKIGFPGLTGATKPDHLSNMPEWMAMAGVSPQDYGGHDWDELRPNPDYKVAYDAALSQAQALAASSGLPAEQVLAALQAEGKIHLPAEQITLSEYAKRNPHPGQQGALSRANSNRQAHAYPGGQPSGNGVPASSIPAKAKQLGMTPDQVRAELKKRGVQILENQ